MTNNNFFKVVPIVAAALLAVNFLLAVHNPYKEKDSPFECGIHSFLAQNRTQFTIVFFLFGLLFLLFDLEILLVYPYAVSSEVNSLYGLTVIVVFILFLALGFVFELGKGALKFDIKKYLVPERDTIVIIHSSISIKLILNWCSRLLNKCLKLSRESLAWCRDWLEYIIETQIELSKTYPIITRALFILIMIFFRNITIDWSVFIELCANNFGDDNFDDLGPLERSINQATDPLPYLSENPTMEELYERRKIQYEHLNDLHSNCGTLSEEKEFYKHGDRILGDMLEDKKAELDLLKDKVTEGQGSQPVHIATMQEKEQMYRAVYRREAENMTSEKRHEYLDNSIATSKYVGWWLEKITENAVHRDNMSVLSPLQAEIDNQGLRLKILFEEKSK
jgi:NADH-ubiquinone oxidoreductase chain 3